MMATDQIMNREVRQRRPQGAASEIDWTKSRELAEQFGYWPATMDPEDIERHRRHNEAADYWLARSRRFDHLRRRAEMVKAATENPNTA